MKRQVLVFPMKEGKVQLAPHKRGPLEGKLNGYGGEIERTDASPRDAACREFCEEAGAVTWYGFLRYRTTILVYRGDELFAEVLVYTTEEWYGELTETEEMGPPESHAVDSLPYDRMMPADADWVPKVFHDIRFEATIYYDRDFKKFEKIEYRDVTCDVA